MADTTFTEVFQSEYRDFESPGSTVPHEPNKPVIRSIGPMLDAALAAAATGPLAYGTWANLNGDTTRPANTYAVVGANDTGTHTDPVVGGTVPNAGLYSYSTSPAGWRRIGPANGPQQVIPSTSEVLSPNIWSVAPRAGYTAPAGDFGSRYYVFAAPADSGPSTYITISGITSVGDPRLLVGPLMTQVVAGEIKKGATCIVRYRNHDQDTPQQFRMEIIAGWNPVIAQPPQSFFRLSKTGRTNNYVDLGSAIGLTFPNATGVGTVFAWVVEDDPVPEFQFLVRLSGINPVDGFPLRDLSLNDVDPLSIKRGDVLFFVRQNASDTWFVALNAHGEAGAVESSGGVDAYYYSGAAAMTALKAQGR